MDEIFERSLETGNRKLSFEQFEKASIMIACLCFPGLHGAEAYVKWADEVLRKLQSIKAPHFVDASVDRAAAIAEALLEKKKACVFYPLMEKVSEAPAKSEENTRRPLSGSIDAGTFDKLVQEVSKDLKMKLRSEAAQMESSPAALSLETLSDAGSELRPKRLARRPVSATAQKRTTDDVIKGPFPLDDTHERALKFQEILIEEFRDLDYAFEYLDSVNGARTKQISATKFRSGWKALGMTGDVKSVFSHIDYNGDGVITLDELKGWKVLRQRQLLKGRNSLN